eukprot:TRINITY_DN2580_c0_g4_i3.p1 TRINITY_DN2580_c0_g4~~TRINITY_DN2580_c0_g4_i3.p1  ORF type:complete len:143 (-),score=36.06 TRINITY_DN2580_c0_g4_i3:339-767(-)
MALQNAARNARLRYAGRAPNFEFVGEKISEETLPQSADATEKLFQKELKRELKVMGMDATSKQQQIQDDDDDDDNVEYQEQYQEGPETETQEVDQEHIDQEEMKDVMMSRKKRKMYNLMMKHKNKKKSKIEKLEKKAKKIKQ